MYTLEWLEERVRWHIRAETCPGAVFVVGTPAQDWLAHCIVRASEGVTDEGLFATTYVRPEARRRGIAGGLIEHGEVWMAHQGFRTARSYPHPDNRPLQALYRARGYTLQREDDAFVSLSRALPR